MKALIYLSVFAVLIGGVAAAEDCPGIGYMLEWKYGPVAGTKGSAITYWNHTSITQPEASQITTDLQECAKEYTRGLRKAAVWSHAKTLHPEFSGAADFKKFSELYQSIDNKTPTAWVSGVIDGYLIASGAINVLNNYTGYGSIDDYDPASDPGWP